MKKLRTMINFDDYLKEALKDPEIKKTYDDLEFEYKLIRARIDKGLTQKQLAEKIGTKQTAISRFESGTYNPTLSFLKKLAKALGVKLEIRIT